MQRIYWFKLIPFTFLTVLQLRQVDSRKNTFLSSLKPILIIIIIIITVCLLDNKHRLLFLSEIKINAI